MGAVDILIVWENLEIHRIVLKNHQTDGNSRSIFIKHYYFWGEDLILVTQRDFLSKLFHQTLSNK